MFFSASNCRDRRSRRTRVLVQRKFRRAGVFSSDAPGTPRAGGRRQPSAPGPRRGVGAAALLAARDDTSELAKSVGDDDGNADFSQTTASAVTRRARQRVGPFANVYHDRMATNDRRDNCRLALIVRCRYRSVFRRRTTTRRTTRNRIGKSTRRRRRTNTTVDHATRIHVGFFFFIDVGGPRKNESAREDDRTATRRRRRHA